jgi:hypothetical protein
VKLVMKAALSTAAAAAMLVVAAAPASAATGQITLFNGGCAADRVGLKVAGTTQGNYGSGRVSRVEFWAADPAFDDLIAGPIVITEPFPISGPASYSHLFCILASDLNEDFGQQDEVYAKLQFSAVGSSQVQETVTTPEIHHYF